MNTVELKTDLVDSIQINSNLQDKQSVYNAHLISPAVQPVNIPVLLNFPAILPVKEIENFRVKLFNTFRCRKFNLSTAFQKICRSKKFKHSSDDLKSMIDSFDL